MKNTKQPKQSMTEKILWAIFNLGELVGGILYVPHTWNQVIYPDYEKIRRMVGQQISRKQFADFLSRFKNIGYLKTKTIEGHKAILLTPKGLKKIQKINLKYFNLKKRKDKKWQMIIFDVPESDRKMRDKFRTTLKALGYQQLQKSVWVSPYDVFRQTEKVIKLNKLASCVKYFLVEKVD